MATIGFTIFLCGGVILGTALLVVGYVTPGWFIINDGGTRRWHNLWYKTECQNDTCRTDTFKDLTDTGEVHELQYSLLVQAQVLATLCLFTAIFGSICTFIGITDSAYSLMNSAKSVRCFAFCVVAMWRIVGSYGGENGALKYDEVGFPYSVFLSGIGTLPLLLVGILNFILSQNQIRKFTASSTEGRPPQQALQGYQAQGVPQKTALVILLLVTIIGFMVLLAGFASPGWTVSDGYSDFWFIHEEKSSAVGLFYYFACKSDGSCHFETLRNVYKNGYDDIDYNLVVANGFCATFSLVIAGCAVFFGIMALCCTKISLLFVNLTEISCLLSATLIWPVIGEILGQTVIRMKPNSSTVYRFPYSLFLSALGSLLLLFVYLFHTARFFWWLYKHRHDSKSGNTQSMEFARL